MGFLEMFAALYKTSTNPTGVLDGTLPVARFFAGLVLPLIEAEAKRDSFAVARIVKSLDHAVAAQRLQCPGVGWLG